MAKPCFTWGTPLLWKKAGMRHVYLLSLLRSCYMPCEFVLCQNGT